jgi:hypothetical protein
MNRNKRTLGSAGLALVVILSLTAPVVAQPADPSVGAGRFTGNVVNLDAGARRSQPFTLTIDHYATQHDVDRFTGILAESGNMKLRDVLWRKHAGTLSIGGGIGYPVSFAVEQDTPQGKSVRVFVDRPMSSFALTHGFRSSQYPFTVIEITTDATGKAQGNLIGAARLRYKNGTLEIKSLGSQPIRLVDIRTS